MRRRSAPWLSVGALIALVASACSSSALPMIPAESPVATTRAWFAAVNAHDMPLALAHFARADRKWMEWSSWGPRFRHLDCSLLSESGSQAHVFCTFDKITSAAAGMSNTTFWSVYLQRDPSSGRWLITGYGQP